MSNEEMVKEAVEEAKAKAAQEEAQAENAPADGEADAGTADSGKAETAEDSSADGAETDGEYLYLTVKTDTEELKRRLIRRWYERTCESKIMSICKNTFVLFERYDLSFPEIRFRYMVSCWGNCRPWQNVLTFNKRLIEAPETCVEYVVMHEFIHFLQADHSKRFYALLTKFMPDWKERVRLLKKQGISANRI